MQNLKAKDHTLFLRYFLFCFLTITIAASVRCQATPRRIRDTVHFKLSVAEKKNLVLSDSALNELGLDSLLNLVQNVHLTLDQINNSTSTGFDISNLLKNFGEVDSNIENISENLTLYNHILDVKNLQMFEVLLTDLQNQITDWRTELMKYNKNPFAKTDHFVQ